MKLRKLVAAICLAGLTAGVFAAESVEDAKEKISTTLNDMTNSASVAVSDFFGNYSPSVNSLLSVQPDAYIGNVFPSIPPHFAVGINISVTPISFSLLNDTLSNISDSMSNKSDNENYEEETSGATVSVNLPNKLPYPSACVSARIGGFFLPFDIGINAMTTASLLKNKTLDQFKFDFQYTSLGADVRYALLEGKGLLPKVSVGAGYQYTSHEFGIGLTQSSTMSIDDPDYPEYSQNVTIENDANIGMKVHTHTFSGQVQVSKTLLILTPYLGVKAMFSKTNCNYDWDYTTTVNGTVYNKLTDSNANSITNPVSVQAQVFGGFSLNLALFQTSFNAAYNLSKNLFTGAIGMSIKL